MRAVVREPTVVQPREAPALARHDLALAEPGRADGEHVVRVDRIAHGVGDMITMRQRQRRRRSLDRPVAAHEPLDGPLRPARDRRVQAQQPGLARHVELPADPDDREVHPHQQAIAEVVVARGIATPGGAIEIWQQRLAAAIAHLEQRDGAARGRPPRPQHHEVRGGLHAAARIAGCVDEVDDGRIRGVRGIQLQLDRSRELFVVAAEDVLPRADDDATHLGAGGRGGDENDHEGGQRDPRLHRAS